MKCINIYYNFEINFNVGVGNLGYPETTLFSLSLAMLAAAGFVFFS